MEDENDNAPVFAKPWYSGHIREDCRVGCLVAMDEMITAHDSDRGVNAKVQLTLLGEDSHLFTLDPTGYLTLAETLDREFKDKLVLRLVASDKGRFSTNICLVQFYALFSRLSKNTFHFLNSL